MVALMLHERVGSAGGLGVEMGEVQRARKDERDRQKVVESCSHGRELQRGRRGNSAKNACPVDMINLFIGILTSRFPRCLVYGRMVLRDLGPDADTIAEHDLFVGRWKCTPFIHQNDLPC